jgi:hypothetical protein
MRIRAVSLLVLVAVSAGCYRATIETGRAASGQTVRQDWAHSFVAGLVPPATVNTASQCPNGVARVQTLHSFLNMIAQFITFSLYSPMTIVVDCAASEENDAELTTLVVPAGASTTAATDVFNQAVTASADQQKAVLVRFE